MILDSLPEEVWHNPNFKWLNPATKNGIFEVCSSRTCSYKKEMTMEENSEGASD